MTTEMTAQEDLAVIPTPKQDERTPGLPDEIRVPLHSLQADVGYLFGRVAADSSCAGAMAQSVRDRLNEIERAYGSTGALREALAGCIEAIGEWSRPTGMNGMRSMPDTHPLNVAARKARTALSGSPAPSTEGLREWQPIETAPRDGTEILTFSDRIGLGNMVLYWADGYWREKANGLGLKYEPTHWQPLPPSPEILKDDQ
jgi:hypothetical protein